MSKMRKEYDPNKVTRRKRKPIIYIICEGKETETLYFKHFRSRNCLVDIIPISSKHKAAEHLVKHAKSLISQADYYPKDGDQLPGAWRKGPKQRSCGLQLGLRGYTASVAPHLYHEPHPLIGRPQNGSISGRP